MNALHLLPTEIWLKILRFAEPTIVATFGEVSRHARALANDPLLWRSFCGDKKFNFVQVKNNHKFTYARYHATRKLWFAEGAHVRTTTINGVHHHGVTGLAVVPLPPDTELEDNELPERIFSASWSGSIHMHRVFLNNENFEAAQIPIRIYQGADGFDCLRYCAPFLVAGGRGGAIVFDVCNPLRPSKVKELLRGKHITCLDHNGHMFVAGGGNCLHAANLSRVGCEETTHFIGGEANIVSVHVVGANLFLAGSSTGFLGVWRYDPNTRTLQLAASYYIEQGLISLMVVNMSKNRMQLIGGFRDSGLRIWSLCTVNKGGSSLRRSDSGLGDEHSFSFECIDHNVCDHIVDHRRQMDWITSFGDLTRSGDLVITGSWDDELYVWDVGQRQDAIVRSRKRATTNGFRSAVLSLVFSNDCTCLYAGHYDGSISLHHVT